MRTTATVPFGRSPKTPGRTSLASPATTGGGSCWARRMDAAVRSRRPVSGQTQASSHRASSGSARSTGERSIPTRDASRGRNGGDRRVAAHHGAADRHGGIGGSGGPVSRVVQAVAVAQEIEPRAGAHVDQGQRRVEPGGQPRESRADHGAPAALVGLRVPTTEQRRHVVTPSPAHVREQRSRIGVRAAGIDVGQRVLEPLEEQAVDGGEEDRWHVRRRGSALHELEQLALLGDRRADPLVEGRVPPALRLGEPRPQRTEALEDIVHHPGVLHRATTRRAVAPDRAPRCAAPRVRAPYPGSKPATDTVSGRVHTRTT